MSGYSFEPVVAIDSGGLSQAVSVSTTSAATTALHGTSARVYPTVDVFVRQGPGTPTAVNTGGDTFLPGGVMYRFKGMQDGNALAFVTVSGTGTVYVTPEA